MRCTLAEWQMHSVCLTLMFLRTAVCRLSAYAWELIWLWRLSILLPVCLFAPVLVLHFTVWFLLCHNAFFSAYIMAQTHSLVEFLVVMCLLLSFSNYKSLKSVSKMFFQCSFDAIWWFSLFYPVSPIKLLCHVKVVWKRQYMSVQHLLTVFNNFCIFLSCPWESCNPEGLNQD